MLCQLLHTFHDSQDASNKGQLEISSVLQFLYLDKIQLLGKQSYHPRRLFHIIFRNFYFMTKQNFD